MTQEEVAAVSSDQVAAGGIPDEPPAFMPRASLLAALDRPGAVSSAVHVLTGPPGTGKTQLAAAYARAKLAAGWRLVAWVNAGTVGTMLAGLAATADAAGLPPGGPGRDTADAGRAVRRRLEAEGDRCLLVLDGAEDLAAVRPFIPACGAAQVLITVNHPAGESLGTDIPVGVATPDEAAAFLVGRTGLADDKGAAAAAAELGYLPLALAQAAAVIAAQHLEYPAYLERLRTTSPGGERDLPYPSGAMKAVLLSLDAARAADETRVSTRVIAIMTVLSAAGVRRELLYTAGQAGVLASGGQRVSAAAVDDVLAELTERSLLTPSLDGRTVTMHQLVAGATRSWLAGRGKLTAAKQGAAALLEAGARALDAGHDRPAARDLSEQVTALLGHAGVPVGKDDEGLARILLRLRFLALYHLIELGDSTSQAVAVGEPLTADLERTLGPDHPDTLNARNSLAAAYLAAGRPAEAVPLLERTLVGRERTLGPNHPDTLTSQNNLAAAYQDVGRVDAAILLGRLTLAARERLLGADHPGTLNSRSNLAAAYRAAGRPAEAVPLLELTLAGRERVLGADHPDTQAARINLDQARRDPHQPPGAFRSAGQRPADRSLSGPPLVELPRAEQPSAELPAAELPRAVGESEKDESRETPTPLILEPEIPELESAGSSRPAASSRVRRPARLPWWPQRSSS